MIWLILFPACRKEVRPSYLTGARNERLAATLMTYEWTFDAAGDPQNWTPVNATMTEPGGTLNVTTTSNDPQLLSPNLLGITSPSGFRYIRVNMKNNSSVTSARIYFTTDADTVWSQAKSKGFTIAANNGYIANYVIDMSTVAGWTGTIRRIRIDPLDPAGGSGQTVVIDYIAITQTVDNVAEWYFDTDGNYEGWMPGNASSSVSGGTLNLKSTSSDPLIFSPDFLGLTNPALYKYVHIDMKVRSKPTSGRVYFITDADTVWNQAKSKSFTIVPDSSSFYGSYIVDMSTVAGWTGTIRRIRIDPLATPQTLGDSVNIDFIRITDNRTFRGVMSPQNGVNSGDIDTLRLWKANVMRWQINDVNAPYDLVRWHGWLDSELVQLDNAFDLCQDLGIKILIDMHWTPGGHNDSGVMKVFQDQQYNDTLVAAWQQIAARYMGRSNLFGYGLINEPIQPTPPTANLDARSTEIRIGNAIRAIDRKTPILISFQQGDDPNAYKSPLPVPLTNVIYEVHMYQPLEFTNQDSNLVTYPGTIEGISYNQAQLTANLTKVRTFQTTYSARMFVGEFSAKRFAPGAATWLQDCINIFEGWGWSWCYHAYREANAWSLEFADTPISNPHKQYSPPTDRYNVVVGSGMSLNQ